MTEPATYLARPERWQFSLRTILIVMTFCALISPWLAAKYRENDSTTIWDEEWQPGMPLPSFTHDLDIQFR